VQTNTPLSWTPANHNLQGNVGLADGSVFQPSVETLNRLIASGTNAAIRLGIPSSIILNGLK
jgi:prepilin-type processing-associated H-X9-DG protein